MHARRRLALAVPREGIEVHLLLPPRLGQLQRHRAVDPPCGQRQQSPFGRRVVGVEIHVVAPVGEPLGQGGGEGQRHRAVGRQRRGSVLRRRQRAVGYTHRAVVHRHRVALQGRTAPVEAHKYVAHRQLRRGRHAPQSEARGVTHAGGQTCHGAEHTAPPALRLRGGTRRRRRQAAHTLPPHPHIPHRRPQPPAEHTQISIVANCHLTLLSFD